MARRTKTKRQDEGLPPFGRKIREARTARGLTLEQLAATSGISTSYLSRLETGAVGRPSESVVAGITVALNVSAAELELPIDEQDADTSQSSKLLREVLSQLS